MHNHELEIEHEQVHEVQASSWDHHNLNRGGGDIERVKKDQENVMQIMGKSYPIGKLIPPPVLSTVSH